MREHSPLPRNVFDFGSQNGDLWCILGAIFCSSAKTLRGRKDALAQVYFYWGGAIAAPPGIDATVIQRRSRRQQTLPLAVRLAESLSVVYVPGHDVQV